ncbi:MAG TPA: hypothetical protein VK465_13985 [Fibrobacteria bacterium]|nr:hypothetical protein [Fibrobacteria bacterium]
MNWAFGPGGFLEMLAPPGSPGTRELKRAQDLENWTGKPRSELKGFKRMSRHVQDAIPQIEQRFPENIHGVILDLPREHGQVFHDMGMGGLQPGPLLQGTESSVDVSADIHEPTARVYVHSHPYTGKHKGDHPSISDQRIARANPQVEHIVQVPAPHPGAANTYLTYSGAVPPRHYILVPNPDNLPVPPPSPDGSVPFRPMPGEGSGSRS